MTLRRFVLLLLAAHVAFCVVRVPYSAYVKRWKAIEAYWHDPNERRFGEPASGPTRRIAEWLDTAVPRERVVLYRGESWGYMQVLARLLAPRLLVHENAFDEQAGRPVGREVFTGRPPWSTANTEGEPIPVVVGHGDHLELVFR